MTEVQISLKRQRRKLKGLKKAKGGISMMILLSKAMMEMIATTALMAEAAAAMVALAAVMDINKESWLQALQLLRVQAQDVLLLRRHQEQKQEEL
eukprot:s1728_g15.t1